MAVCVLMPAASRRLPPALLALVGLIVGPACRPVQAPPPSPTVETAPLWPEAPQNNRVVCLLSDARMPFQRAQAQFLSVLDAKDTQHRLSFRDAQGDPDLQLNQIQALTAEPPKALLLQPANPALYSNALAQLRNKGTRIFIIDPPQDFSPNSSPAEAILSCDPFQIGLTAAKITLQALSRRAHSRGQTTIEGRVVEFRGSDESPWCSRVHAGFVKGLQAQPAVLLVHDAPTDWLPKSIPPRLAEALRLQKSVDVIFAHDDFLAQSAHEATTLDGSREEILIIGVNAFSGPEGGLEMIRRNQIDASIMRPFLVDQAWNLISGPIPKDSPKAMTFPPKAILPADLDQAAPPASPQPNSSATR